MSETLPDVRPSRQPAAHARRPALNGSARSSHGWSPASRAPELRRLAELVERRASGSPMPNRARRLARDMRLRAAAIEAGPEPAAGESSSAALDSFAAMMLGKG